MAAKKTPSQKAAAMHAAKIMMQDNTTSEGHDARPVRQAKSNAYKNQVWMTEKNTARKRVSSNNAESDHVKVPRINQKDVTSESIAKAPAASALFDSDNDDNVAAPSGKSDENRDSEGDLDKSKDDLKCFKGDTKKLKEALVLEHPQFTNRARSKSSSLESQHLHVRMDDDEHHMAHSKLSDGDSEDDLQPKSKTPSGETAECRGQYEPKGQLTRPKLKGENNEAKTVYQELDTANLGKLLNPRRRATRNITESLANGGSVGRRFDDYVSSKNANINKGM
ncbi:hypothetical protein BDR03DRAFT_985445 [Suillus americanus]|nr:hypothetical protein BDR03DRAFT_985445 [Suillus americanus]